MDIRQLQYYEAIEDIVESKGGRVLSDRYTKMIDKMWFECENGHQWDTEARSILKGIWCRYCHGNTREQGEISFHQRVAEKGGIILGPYLGNHKKVLVQCKLGHQWEVLPHNLASGKWCPACGYVHHGGGSARFMQTVNERKGKVLGEYINAKTRIKVQCENGHIWDPKPYYVVIGNWCPLCDGTTGEQAIATYLNERNIPFRSQTNISGLKRKRYDFIITYNGQNCVIEFDGQLHFKYMEYYHGTFEYFEHRQAVDRVKTLHAISKNYRVIRIDYSKLLKIKDHLDAALELSSPLYVSTPRLYQGWFLNHEVTPEEIAKVNKGRSRPCSLKYCLFIKLTNNTYDNNTLSIFLINYSMSPPRNRSTR